MSIFISSNRHYCHSLCHLLFFVCLAPLVSAKTIELNQLTYRNPAALEVLLAQSEKQFALSLKHKWPRIKQQLQELIPPHTYIHYTSVFFQHVTQACKRKHDAHACRLYMDFLVWIMKSKRTKHESTYIFMPTLMRPAQLPWRDTAILQAVLSLHTPLLESALDKHWKWIHHILQRYLPDSFDLHPISKVFGDVRTSCMGSHTEIACRLHLSDIVSIVNKNHGSEVTVFRRLQHIAYHDPAPLYNLLALSAAELSAQLTTNWIAIDKQLNTYIPRHVAIIGDIDFARSRLDCLEWMPGDYFLCRLYISNLAELMYNKRSIRDALVAH